MRTTVRGWRARLCQRALERARDRAAGEVSGLVGKAEAA